MKETDLFPAVKNWLEDRGYEVFAEVTGLSGRADVIGKMGKAVINIELKKQMSFELLGQAIERKDYFHYVYVAIPKRKNRLPKLAYDILRKEGIGLLEVLPDVNWAEMYMSAKFNRPPRYQFIDWDYVLRPEYKQHVGGDNGSHIQTPYKLLMTAVREYLTRVRYADNSRAKHGGHRNYGWVKIDDILAKVEADRHYASPRNSLSQALINFEQNWCEVKKENGKLYYRVKM